MNTIDHAVIRQTPDGTTYIDYIDVITLPATIIGEVKEVTLRSSSALGSSKISGIKCLRNKWEEIHGSKLGLKCAKHAIERVLDEAAGKVLKGDKRTRLGAAMTIKKIVVQVGAEEVEVDLEELQFRILSDMGTIGFNETGALLELVTAFEKWEASYMTALTK